MLLLPDCTDHQTAPAVIHTALSGTTHHISQAPTFEYRYMQHTPVALLYSRLLGLQLLRLRVQSMYWTQPLLFWLGAVGLRTCLTELCNCSSCIYATITSHLKSSWIPRSQGSTPQSNYAVVTCLSGCNMQPMLCYVQYCASTSCN